MKVVPVSNILPLQVSVLSGSHITKTGFSASPLLSDSSCQIESFESCNVIIQAIFAPSIECICADENPCNVLQLLASFCRSYLGTVYSTRLI